jgi:hypothetical protein
VESHSIGLTGTTFHRWQITDQRSVAMSFARSSRHWRARGAA